jgi:3-polyprenyl-4-hydroxybenzoate decarboxylase
MAGPSPYRAPLEIVRQEIKSALELLGCAAKAYRQGQGKRAALLFAAAETSYFEMLVNISDLTEEEADLVEPDITELEVELTSDRLLS